MSINTYSLITLSECKDFMGMSDSDSTTDDLLEDLINRVSILFESYMNRNILSREYTEYFDGKGESILFPKQSKITTISGVWDDYGWEWDTDDLIASTDYKIVDDTFIVFKTTSLNDYTQNVKIIYTAGYSTTPDDLIQACIVEVSRMYKNKNSVDITSKTLSDGSVSFYDKGILPLTIITLNKYKRVSIV